MGDRPIAVYLSVVIMILCASTAIAKTYVIGVVLRNPEKYPLVKDTQIALDKAFLGELRGELGRELREKHKKLGLEPPAIKFKVRFDEYDEGEAFDRRVAEELAQDPSVVAVIGHMTSNSALAAGKIYDRENLVMITPTATNPAVTHSSKWVFSMIYDDDWQASMIAAYVARVLSRGSVLVVYEDSQYGTGLKTSFERQAGINRLTIVDTVAVAARSPEALIHSYLPRRLADFEKSGKTIEAVMLFVSAGKAVELVKQLRLGGIDADIPIVGPDALSTKQFLDELQVKARGEILKRKSVVLICGGGPYDRLGDRFAEQAKNHETKIVKRVSLTPDTDVSSDFVAAELAGLAKPAEPFDNVVVLADRKTTRQVEEQLIRSGIEAQSPAIDWDGIGFEAGKILVANPYFHELAPLRTHELTARLTKLISAREQEEAKGKGDKGLTASASAPVQQEIRREPTPSSLYAFDAARLIAEGIMEYQKDPEIRKLLQERKTQARDARQAIKSYLSKLDSVNKALHGMSGKLYFDANGGAMHRPVLFSWIKGTRFFPAFTQIMEVPGHGPSGVDEPQVDATRSEQEPGRIVINRVPMKKVSVVYAGIDFYRINDINLRRQRFDAEVFVWLKWQNPKIDLNEGRKDQAMFFWNGIYGIEDRTDLMIDKSSSDLGFGYVAFKVKGTYLKYFDLHRYPFDTQKLGIRLSLAGFGTDQVLLVVDEANLSNKRTFEIFPKEYSLIEKDGNPSHYSGTWRLDSSLGDPYRERISGREIEFSVYTTTLEIQRDPIPYILQLFLPLIILTAISLLVFWIPVKQFQVRITLVLTALLSTLVFHVSRADALPNVGYLTLADKYFVASYCFMTVNIGVTIAIEWLRLRTLTRAQTINSIFRYVLTVVNAFTFFVLASPVIVKHLGLYSALFFAALLWLLYEILNKSPEIRAGIKRFVFRKVVNKAEA